MNESVERLRGIMPPPPEGGDVIDWDGVETRSGVRLPGDYRDFVGVYGGGIIDDILEIHTPDVPGSLMTGVPDAPVATRVERDLGWLSRVAPGTDPGRLLRFGSTDDGDELLWVRSDGEPENWRVLLWLRHPPTDNAWTLFDGGMARFLLALVSGELTDPDPFDRPDFPADPPTYLGWRAYNRLIGLEA